MQSKILRPRGKPLFGPAPDSAPETPSRLAEQLNQRLREKYLAYERAAARLELRGERDAAQVLRRAASRARRLRKSGGE